MSEQYMPDELAEMEAEAERLFYEYGPSYSEDDEREARRHVATEPAPAISTDGKTLDDLAAEYGIVCPAEYDDETVPEREWWIEGLVPIGQVTLLYGDGGVGKSLLALQWGLAGAADVDTLGISPERGGVFYLGAEDEEIEFKRRQVDICKSLGLYLRDLHDFRLMPMAGEDAVMAVQDASKRMVPTEVFRRVEAFVNVMRPRCIILDTAADLFGGNEIDRGQVRQFVGMLRGLAIKLRCAVILLAHPSVAGMMSGTGTSGSTGWSNSARSRLYLTRPDPKYDDDPDVRILKTMKANYGTVGGEIKLRWEKGAFVLNSGSRSGLMVEAKAERVFMDCLATVDRNIGRVTFAKTSAQYYAPKVFAQMPEADGVNVRQFEKAMDSLRRSGRITEINHGTLPRPTMGIVDAAARMN
ncbi:AAA family ATPase [Rhizobium herbae]|uniref:RecA-family ATPase n=1 Tax=Rhizobium herbae TaxID=508661 RepID=A0ABS4EFP2_9HYPH|nr:AAA family ATPase [Rhizobium herbae]MBP1856766.1 RecA-family ATPase [Rhizobium herbae]